MTIKSFSLDLLSM